MMKFKIYLLSFLISFSLFGLTKSEVIKMAKMGLSENTLMATVNGSTDIITMEKADVIEMKKAGVPEPVIKELIKRYLKHKEAIANKEAKDPSKLTAEELKKQEEEKKKKEEEEKIRAEEERKTEERIKKRKQAQLQREYKEKILPLNRAKHMYKKGDYLGAIKKINKFFKAGFEESSDEIYQANFYLGMSFYKAGAIHSAIKTLNKVLIKGPEVKIGNHPKGAFFMLAFETYGELTGNWPFSSDFNDTYQMVSTYNTALLPKKFQVVYNYYMGKYYTKWASNASKAGRYLIAIEPSEKQGKIIYPKLYASAQYLLGLNKVKSKKYNESIKHFQNTIIAIEGKTDFKNTSLRDLSYIALGRIYYEIASSYFAVRAIDMAKRLAEASLESYKKVSKDSPKLATAYYESSWAAFITGNYDLSIGYLHSLHSAYLKDYYFPDKYILEAGIYVNMCLFNYADEAVSSFKKKYDPFKRELEDFLSEPIEPKEYMEKIQKIAESKPIEGKRFSYELISYIISDGYFYETYKSLKKLQKEKQTLEAWSNKGKSKYEVLNTLYNEIIKKERKLYNSIGQWTRRKLQNALNNLDELYLKTDEISFEIIGAEKKVLENEKLALTQKTEKSQSNKPKSSKEYNLQDDEMMWKFTGEYWVDEIDNYRSFLQSKCK